MKKILLGFSFFGVLTFLVLDYLYKAHSTACKFIDTETDYYNTCELTGSFTIIFIPIFVFSIIFFFVKNEDLFKSWKKFTFIYLSIYLLLLLTRTTDGGDFDPARGDTAWFLSLNYFCTALAFCIHKMWEIRRTRDGRHVPTLIKWSFLFISLGLGVATTVLLANIGDILAWSW